MKTRGKKQEQQHDPSTAQNQHARRWLWPVVFAAGIVVLALFAFRTALKPGYVLFTTDSNLGLLARLASRLPGSFLGASNSAPLLGGGGVGSPVLHRLLLWLLPVNIYNDFIYAIYLGVASLFLAGFLRLRRLSWWACAVAAVTAFWVGSNLTLAYAGHIGKFGVLMFGAATLFCIEKAVVTRKTSWYVLTGGTVAGMFMEQQDVALLLGMFLGAYALFATVREHGRRCLVPLVQLLVVAVVAAVVSGPIMLRSYTRNVKQAAPVAKGTEPSQKWDYVTQWSFPPDEALDLLAPGYTGWRSNDPEGPYWGRTGQSAEWGKSQQGFRNFRLESVYIGALPLILAMFALYAAFFLKSGKDPGEKKNGPAMNQAPPWSAIPQMRADVVFWSVVALVALLLSFGKYFPLYRLFYQLPVVNAIRNPNKLLHPFQVAVGVLSAYGVDALLRAGHASRSVELARRIKGFAVGVLVAGVLLLGYAGFLSAGRAVHIDTWASRGWGEAAPLIVQNMVSGAARGGLWAVVGAALIWVLACRWAQGKKWVRTTAATVVVLVLVADVSLLSRHYLKSMKVDANVGNNAVVQFLKEHLGHERFVLLTQSGFYNNWLNGLFPYHGLTPFNIAQSPRMPTEHKQFLGVVGRHPLRLWQLSSIRYILAPAQVWKQIQADPRLSQKLEPVFGFNVFPRSGGIGVAHVQDVRQAQHLIFRYDDALPMFQLFSAWDKVPRDEMCSRLVSPEFDPSQRVLIDPETAVHVPDSVGAGNEGTVNLSQRDRRTVKLSTSADVGCVLLFNQKFQPHWQAWVDGERTDMLRCNFLASGVYVPAGDHDVRLRFAPSLRHLWIQGFGMLICLAAGVQLVVSRRRQ